MNSAVRVILPTTSPFFGRRGPVWLLSQGLTPIRPAHRGLCRGEGRVASLAQVLAEYRDRVSLFAQSEQEWACLWRQMEALCERPGLDAQVRCFLEANLREHGQVYSAVLAGEKAMRERRPLLLASTRALTHPEMNLWGRHLSADFAADYLAVLALATLRHVRANPALQCHRRAGSEQDRVCPSHSECVVVCRAGQYYHLPLRGVPAEQLFEVLRQAFLYLVSAGHSPAESLPVGLLSTLPRHDTAHGYGLLHPETLARILDCQLLVSLEQMDQVDTGQCESGRAEVARHLLQSDPANIGHRWLDKGIQLVVIGNRDLSRLYGSGVCFEPSVVSTGSVARLVESTVRFVSSFQVGPCPLAALTRVDRDQPRPSRAWQWRCTDCDPARPLTAHVSPSPCPTLPSPSTSRSPKAYTCECSTLRPSAPVWSRADCTVSLVHSCRWQSTGPSSVSSADSSFRASLCRPLPCPNWPSRA